MRSQWADLSVICHEFKFQLNSATLFLKVLSFPSNKVNAKMASIAFKIFIRASKIDMFHSSIFIYEFNAARWSNFKRSTVIFPCINHSLIANAIWDSGTKQEICFQVLLFVSHCIPLTVLAFLLHPMPPSQARSWVCQGGAMVCVCVVTPAPPAPMWTKHRGHSTCPAAAAEALWSTVLPLWYPNKTELLEH